MFPRTSLNNHYSTGPYLASQGNPNLLPFKSDNIDFSLEWYYNEGSYASVGYFHKKVDNFIGTDTEMRVINGPNGPLTNPSANPRGDCPTGTVAMPDPNCVSQPGDPVITWEVTTPLNRSDTEVYGWEFNVQHMFGESGFGVIANYTLVDTDDEFDVYSRSNEYNVAGLSDSANLIGFYEKDAWQVRLAYNWRDEFILGATNGEPKFVAEYGQWDLSASYTFREVWNVYFEAINLTDEKTHRYGRWENQIYDYETYGPRYTLGLRARW
jgi:TonB-dependent receptor